MKIEAAVFPFHERMLPFVRHFNRAQDTYHICQVLTWSGMGLNGQDAAYICRHRSIGIPVVSTREPQSFATWDVLFVDWDELKHSANSFNSFSFFKELLSKGKQIVIVTKESYLCSQDEWNDLCYRYPKQIHIVSTQNSAAKKAIPESNSYRLLSIPVLMVGGLITQEDCLEIILALREAFTTQGKVVSCLTGSNMGLLLGMHSYTHIFDVNAGLSEEDKAMALNKLAQNIIRSERPSLLIMEAPDPMLKYNNATPNGFGLQTYLICQAIKPDFLVCSVPPDLANEDAFLTLVSQDFKNRYGANIAAVHISNVVIESFDTVQFHRIARVHTDLERVWSLQKQQNGNRLIPAFDVVSDGAEELAQLLVQKEETL